MGECLRAFLAAHERAKKHTPPSRPPRPRPPRDPSKDEPPTPPPAFLRRTRYVAAEVVREVWARDGGCCAFRSPDGRVCGSRYQLELDHVEPYALGGAPTATNLRLCCKRHNRWRARQTFGERRFSSEPARPPEPSPARPETSGLGDRSG